MTVTLKRTVNEPNDAIRDFHPLPLIYSSSANLVSVYRLRIYGLWAACLEGHDCIIIVLICCAGPPGAIRFINLTDVIHVDKML